MNRIILALTVALTVVVAGLTADAFGQGDRIGDDGAEARKHGWVLNYNEARRQARKTNRPLMVVFRCIP